MSKKTAKRKPNNKVGPLVGGAAMSLHSVETIKLWSPGQHSSVPSVVQFFGAMSTLEVAARNDDPYADYALLEIERAMNDAFGLFEQCLASLPVVNSPRVQYQEVYNRKPLVKQFVNQSRFGWRLVMLLEQFDVLMVRLLDAQFKTLIGRTAFEQARKSTRQAMRGILTLSRTLTHSGITRQDVAANNAKALAAQKKHGAIPLEVLEGIERAEFAPDIRQGGYQ